MDPLTEIFTQMRIRKASFTRLDATAPWGFMSKGEQAVKFVLVVRGLGNPHGREEFRSHSAAQRRRLHHARRRALSPVRS